MTRAEIEELLKRVEAEELRMQRLWQVASDYRDKHHGTDSAFDWNAMRHAISGRDPVLPEAATLARQLLAVIEENEKLRDELERMVQAGSASTALSSNADLASLVDAVSPIRIATTRARAALQGETPDQITRTGGAE